MLLLPSPRHFLAGSISFLAAFADDQCSLPQQRPFLFRLANCSLTATIENLNSVHAWGLVLGIATPMQDVCIVPSFVTNNTVIMATDVCPNSSTLPQCHSLHGGVFNPNQATSDFMMLRHLPTTDFGLETINLQAGKAMVQFASGFSLSNFSFALASFALPPALMGRNSSTGYFGLASDSVFLQNVVTAGYSAVRAIGIYTGSQSVANPRDGHIVVGGYDAASLAGPFTTYALSNTTMNGTQQCSVQLEIDLLTLNLPGARDIDLIVPGDSIIACIEPYDNLFRMPINVINQFKINTGWLNDSTLVSNQLYIAEPGIYYRSGTGFNGTLSFKLKDGLIIKIPNEELAHPVRGLDPSGKLVLQPNVTVVNILHDEALQNTASLGKVFLSQVYLTVNYDVQQFQIAPAITDDPVTPDLVPFPNAAFSLTNCSAPAPTSSGTQTSSIIVGVTVAAVLLVLCIYLLWQQKHSRKRDQTLAAQMGEHSERIEAITLCLNELDRRVNVLAPAPPTLELSSAREAAEVDATMPTTHHPSTITQIISNMTTGAGTGATTDVSLNGSISHSQPNNGLSSCDQGKTMTVQAGTE